MSFVRPGLLLVLGTVAALTAAALTLPAPEPRLRSGPVATTTPSATTLPPAQFTDVSLDWQMVPTHQQLSTHLTDLTETLGSGLCALDANNDGWMDIFFIGGSGHTRDYGRKAWWLNPSGNRLLLNQGGKYFVDATAQAGLTTRHVGMGCAVADFDNDGLRDLLVTGVGNNFLYRNDGNGHFTDVSATSGLLRDHWSTGVAVADFNRDGLVDIYIGNYILYRKGARAFEAMSGFKATRDGPFDPTLYDPEPNRLYVNQGGFQFLDQAAQMQVADSQGRSLGARWVDVNDDRWPDLLVINDHGSSNKLFLNQQGKSFVPADKRYAPLEVDGVHDVQLGDFNNDGHDDFFMTRGSGHPPILLQRSGDEPGAGTGPARYVDAARAAGLVSSRSLAFTGWSATPGDFNNDGFIDLYLANGSMLPDIDSPFVSLAQPNELFLNRNGTSFVAQSATPRPSHPYSSRGSVAVDLDNDGILEILVSNNNNQLQILKNSDPGAAWIGLDFSPNQDATNFGAIIEATSDRQTLRKILRPALGFLSQGDPRVVFGLGEADKINRLRIRWPDGHISDFADLQAGSYYRVHKTDNRIVRIDSAQASQPHNLILAPGRYSDSALSDIAWMLMQRPEENRELIDDLWTQASSKIRAAMLAHIGASMDKRLLNLAMKALSASDPEILLLAIETARKAELEAGVARLIPLLRHSDPRVQCATADAFRFFFDEEEAVTQRKRLAVSPLIRLLETGSDQATICAANALAAAERQRAVLALLDQLGKRDSPLVKAAVMRALGLIRDTRAIPHLHYWINHPAASPSMIANGLIALARLNDPQLPAVFDDLATSDTRPVALRYAALALIFRDDEGIVLPRPILQRTFDAMLSQPAPVLIAADTAMLDVIGAGRLVAYEALVHERLDTPAGPLRNAALAALANLGTTSARTRFEDTLRHLPAHELAETLAYAPLAGYRYSATFIADLGRILLDALTKDPNSFQPILRLLSSLEPISAAELFDAIAPGLSDTGRIRSVLNLCSDRTLAIRQVNDVLLQHPSPMVRGMYVDCILNRHADLDQMQRFRLRFILRDILTARDLDDDIKRHLLLKFAAVDDVVAKTYLLRMLSDLPDDWRENAVAALRGHPPATDMQDLLWDTLNGDKSHDIRVKAARILIGVDADKIQAWLRSTLLNSPG